MGAKARSGREPLIWSSVLRGLELPISEQNLDFDALLESCEIARDDLLHVHGKISLKKYLRFMEQAARTADDPLLGIRMARSCGPETLGALGFLFLSSRTLAAALTDFSGYLNLLQDTTDFRTSQDRRTIAFHYQLYGIPDIDCRQDVEFSIALTSRLIRMFGGPEVSIDELRFRHSPSVPVADYERLMKVKARFNQETNCVMVPAAMGRVRGHAIDSSLAGVLKDFLNAELHRRGHRMTFVDQVRRALLGNRIQVPVTGRENREAPRDLQGNAVQEVEERRQYFRSTRQRSALRNCQKLSGGLRAYRHADRAPLSVSQSRQVSPAPSPVGRTGKGPSQYRKDARAVV